MRRKRSKIALVLLLAAAGLFVWAAWRSQPRPPHAFFDGAPLVIAHRGGLGLAPENTLVAFGRAAELGADVLELDVRLSRDGELVVIHDRRVDRTTQDSGRVEDRTLRQLKRLDAGYRWTADGGQSYPFRGQGVEIPTLDEVLAAFGGQRFNIELKVPAATELCRVLTDFDAVSWTLAASFNGEALEALRRLCPQTPTSATAGESLVFFLLSGLRLDAAWQPPAAALQWPVRMRSVQLIDRRLIERARRHGVEVHAWTVNDEARMRQLIDIGVGGIITDYPDRMLRLLGRL